MFIFTWFKIPPPTPKAIILTSIQKSLFIVTLIYAILISFSQPILGLCYLISGLFLFNAYRQLSYFSCVIHQLFCWSMCTHLILKLSVSLQNGILPSQLNLQLINKMFIVCFSVFCFYFDFVAYKQYKAIAVEVKEEGES